MAVSSREDDGVSDRGYLAGELMSFAVGDLHLEWIDECFPDTVAPELAQAGVGEEMAFRDLLDNDQVIVEMGLS